MRWLLRNHIDNAVESLRSNRMRAFLTMLGVAIGVASITTILSLSNGAISMTREQVAKSGHVTVVRPGAPVELGDFISINSSQSPGVSTITEADLGLLSKIQHVEAVAPLMTLSGVPRSGDSMARSGLIAATTPDLARTTTLPLRDGQFLEDSSGKDSTAVIGTQLSIDLFGTENSVGYTFTVRNQKFRVIGVLKRLNEPVNFNGINFDNTALIHLDSGKKFNEGTASIQQVNLLTDGADGADKAITETLTKAHDGEQDFSVISGDAIAAPTNRLLYTIAGATIAIATVALIVGGIGIMNILLVSVAERTREIGLRKALGATNTDIAWQFLIESVAISIGGGLAGYVIGYILSFLVSLNLTFSPTLSWQIAAITVGISAVVGLVFGLYPAIRAARKNPIESLRHH